MKITKMILQHERETKTEDMYGFDTDNMDNIKVSAQISLEDEMLRFGHNELNVSVLLLGIDGTPVSSLSCKVYIDSHNLIRYDWKDNYCMPA